MNSLQTPKRKTWLRWLNIALVVYLLGGISVYWLQDRLMFHPETLPINKPYDFSAPHREINMPMDEKTSINIVQFLTSDSLPKGIVLYFHGNRKNIAWYAPYASNFTKRGYEVWMMDYPGFGKSTGILSEQNLYDAAAQLYIMAHSKFAANHIIIYGKSLGTGIASWLASKRTAQQLILETPYYSMISLAKQYLPIYPINTLIRFKLPVYKYLGLVNAPVTIFHGTSDKVIPYRNAERLMAVIQPKDNFITIEHGGHNDLNTFPIFHEKLDSLLAVSY
ncbi:MAG TPA: alpha/beta fold hydrolase [Agriterribacter sp.]|nr:alpha/beta fold hydrolase [Agriterribacter sp.]